MPSPSLVIAIGTVLPIVDTFFVGLRLYAKQKKHGIGLDDFFIGLGLLFTVALGTILTAGTVHAGFGQHSIGNAATSEKTANEALLDKTRKYSVIFSFLGPWALGTIKLSVLFFYRRIFRGKAFNIVSWTVIGIVIAWTISSFFPVLFQCGTRVWLLWTTRVKIAKHCFKGSPLALYISSVDVITDVMIMALPIYWVMNLHLPLFRRVLVCGVFLFGSLALAASIGRLVGYVLIFPHHATKPDQMEYLTTVPYYTMLEIGLSVIAACLPTLGPIISDKTREEWSQSLRGLFSSRFSSSSSSRRQQPMKFNNISEANFLKHERSKERSFGVESFAMTDSKRDHSPWGEEIRVVKETSQHSSLGP